MRFEGKEPTDDFLPGVLLTDEAAASLSGIITELMRPVMQTIGKLLEENTAAIERLSATQQVQNERMEALEKQIRLQTPVTSKQVSYLNAAIKGQARKLLDKRGIDNAKATAKLGNQIRRAVLSRYGIASLREVPKHEYGVAMSQIETWNDLLAVRDVTAQVRQTAALLGVEDKEGTQ